jgi:lipopolysaccharide exporter
VRENADLNVLLAKTARGAGWVISWRFATRALGLVSTLTLVRLLAPTDFGLVALATSFAQAVDAFSDLGVEDVVVRERAPTPDFYNTAFTINVLRGIATALLIAAAAEPAATFFGEPRLAPILLALAVGSLIDAFENIGIVDFRRHFAFGKEFRLQILPRIVGIVLTIVFAFLWANYWALIVGIVSTRIIRIILGYSMHPHRPRFTLSAWRQMVGFSVWTWFLSIATLLRDRSTFIVIGRLMTSTQLGIFAVATEVATLPSTEFVEPLCRVAFSGFIAARHAGMGVADTFMRIIGITSLLILPAGFGISLLADPIVRLMFGPRWLDAIPLVEILGVASTVTVLGYVTTTLFGAHALLSTLFRINAISTVLRVAALIVLTREFGLPGGALALGLAMGLEQIIYLLAMRRRFALRPLDLLRYTWRCVLATMAMTGLLVTARLGWVAVDGGKLMLAGHLVVAVSLGVASYAAVLFVAWSLSGRPSGAESDVIASIRRMAARFAIGLCAKNATGSGGPE